jgi:hypothetical protein
MAKRSVKKARQRTPAGPPAPASPPSLRQFWIGVVVAAAVLVPLAVVGVVIASGGDEQPEDPQAAVQSSIEEEAAELRRITQVRDKEQVKELTDRMRGTVDAVAPVISGIGDKQQASPATVDEWLRTVRQEDEFFAETVSGETGTNVARGGFAAALDTLIQSVESYRLALAQPAARAELLRRAREQRDLALRTWSVAATQLDAINIATGYGHQHVYLSGTEAAGGFGADPAPEGSGAEGGE